MACVPNILPAARQRDDALLARFTAAGYRLCDPPILQPADVFLEASGESIRRSLFLTLDVDGRELCLRPDLTIPVAREVMARQIPLPAAVSYLGPVFRFQGEQTGEFRQAGVESFGRTDIEAADADILALAIETCSLYGLSSPRIRLGDLGLFCAFLDALPLAPVWRRRLIKDFGQNRLDADLSRLDMPRAGAGQVPNGVLNALAGADPHGARALITDLLSIAGITTVGGRSVAEIAERFLEQSTLQAGAGLPAETALILSRYLTLGGAPHVASAQIRALASEAGLSLEAALDRFDRRTDLFAARGVVPLHIDFSTAFGRPLDYYSGLVFELEDPTGRVSDPLVAGGRYDPLLARIGHGRVVPAVGFAAFVERLALLETPQ